MKFKLCIDPGHGLGNRTPSGYDSGCARGDVHESDIVLAWALCLRSACLLRGVEVWLTRENNAVAAPLSKRVSAARKNGCTHLISLHVNDAAAKTANGVETLYRKTGKATVDLARSVQALAVKHLGLRDRTAKARDDLAILKHPNSVLLELGFIGSSSDLAAMQCPCCRRDLCAALAGLYAGMT